jgi:thymidylate synthase (FAD)
VQVKLIAHTVLDDDWFCSERPREWQPIFGRDAELLIEFAGRNCYQSWSNPGKKTNADYIKNIIEHGHGSVLEHASVTFFITGVSRSLTHELIRHRHLSFSELSQRYVNVEEAEFVCPPLTQRGIDDGSIEEVPGAREFFRAGYAQNVDTLQHVFPDATRKQVREAARCILPNSLESKIVVSGNLRAWRAFIDARANEHADAEICALAVEIATRLKDRYPNVFQDYTIEGGYCYTHYRKI